jgi:hypothetical protein
MGGSTEGLAAAFPQEQQRGPRARSLLLAREGSSQRASPPRPARRSSFCANLVLKEAVRRAEGRATDCGHSRIGSPRALATKGRSGLRRRRRRRYDRSAWSRAGSGDRSRDCRAGSFPASHPSGNALRRTTIASPLRTTPEAAIPRETTPKSWTLTGVHVSTSESRGGRRYSLGKVLATVGTVFGVVGGAAGLYTFLRSEFPDPRITAQHVGFEGETIIQVGVVNSSPRAISIVGGEVRWKGLTVGQVSAVLDTSQALGIPTTELQGAKRLPFPIAGGESFAGGVLWDRGDSLSRGVLEGFRKTLSAPRSPERRKSSDIELELNFEPGGKKTARIELLVVGAGDALRPFPGHDPGWFTKPITEGGGPGRVRGLRVGANLGEPAVVRLELWRDRAARATATLERPLSIHRPTDFSFPRLRPGRYDWALTAGADSVAVGDFTTPCGKSNSDTPPPERCSDVD